MAVTGQPQDKEVVSGFGASSARPLVTPATNQSNKAVIQHSVGREKVSDMVVIKVGMLLIRKKNNQEEVWIPTQTRRTVFPLWNIGGVLKENDTEGEMWAKVEMEIQDIIVYDFPQKTRATAELMDLIMAKVVILHKVQEDTTFAYFIGYLKVREEFDSQPQRQNNWIAKSELLEMVRDAKARRGSVTLSTRVIATTFRSPLFEK